MCVCINGKTLPKKNMSRIFYLSQSFFFAEKKKEKKVPKISSMCVCFLWGSHRRRLFTFFSPIDDDDTIWASSSSICYDNNNNNKKFIDSTLTISSSHSFLSGTRAKKKNETRSNLGFCYYSAHFQHWLYLLLLQQHYWMCGVILTVSMVGWYITQLPL